MREYIAFPNLEMKKVSKGTLLQDKDFPLGGHGRLGSC